MSKKEANEDAEPTARKGAAQVNAEKPRSSTGTESVVPRQGMAHIPRGALVLGTPLGRKPRRPDRELGGEQVLLEAFYIDQYPFPNEEGAIPLTNVSQEEASVLCEKNQKRLCTELEWERACKGPDNRAYEYGDAYRESVCGTGRKAELGPSGYRVGCQSDFGVRDLHGGAFEWTLGEYGRGGAQGSAAVRGGNSPDGELTGRCANVEPVARDTRSGTIGFRCCAGPLNPERISVPILFSAGLLPRAHFDTKVESDLVKALPAEPREFLERGGRIRSERAFLWRPVDNEEFHALAVCGRGVPAPWGPRCGLILGKVGRGSTEFMAFVPSGQLVADIHRPSGFVEVWVIGGDRRGAFRRALTYQYGDLMVSEEVRKTGEVPRRRKQR